MGFLLVSGLVFFFFWLLAHSTFCFSFGWISMQLKKTLIFLIKVKILSFGGKLRPPNSTCPALPTCQSGCRWEAAALCGPHPALLCTSACSHWAPGRHRPSSLWFQVQRPQWDSTEDLPRTWKWQNCTLLTCHGSGKLEIKCWERPAGVANSSGWKKKAAHGPGDSCSWICPPPRPH